MSRYICALLRVGVFFLLIACALAPCAAQDHSLLPKTVAVYDFATASPDQIVDPDKLATSILTADPSEEINGERSLKGDSRASQTEWNEFFHSKAGIFVGHDTAYRVSLNYKILARNPNTQFYMMFRRADGTGDQGQVFWTGAAGRTGHQDSALLTTHDDYYLMIGIEHQGAISVNDITIRTDPMNTPHDVHLPAPVSTWKSPGGTAYYADSVNGSDANEGLTAAHAWKSLERINTGTFGPGDKILLKSGSRWQSVLTPGGSGVEGRPIRMTAYGAGPKPSIDAHGRYLATLYLHNQEYWDVSDLDIANTSPWRQPSLSGVQVRLDNFGTAYEIRLRALDVHDVHGSNVKDLGGGNGIFCANEGDQIRSRFDGLIIDGCHLTRTDRNGITMNSAYWHRDQWFPNLRVVIRNNQLDDIGGDGIVPIGCDGALIAKNVIHGARRRALDYAAGIWPWSCDNTVVQYNEVSGMTGTNDGEGYDSDWNCRNTVIQYNYSHDNDGGFMLICNNGSVTVPTNIGNTGTVIRYNISVHDHDHTFNIAGPVNDATIYNNVFVIGNDAKLNPVNVDTWGGFPASTRFVNNIFTTDGPTAFNLGTTGQLVFSNNAYWGAFSHRPADAHAVTKNPMLTGFSNGAIPPRGVRLLPGSPCIGAGVPMPRNGGRDYWGKPISATGKPDIGAG